MLIELIAICAVLVLGMLGYKWPQAGLALLAFFLPAYGLRLSILGIPSTVLELSIYGFVIGWWAKQLFTHGLPSRPLLRRGLSEGNPFAPYVLPITAWLIVTTIAAIVSPNTTAALGLWKAYIIDPLLVVTIAVVVLRGRAERWWIVWGLVASMAALGVVAWVQHFTHVYVPAPWDTSVPFRVTSLYSYPNGVGLYFAPIIAMLVAWVCVDIKQNKWRSWRTLFKIIALAIGVGAIMFSLTKGAWMGVAVATAVAILLVWREYWRIWLGVAIVGVLLVFAIPQLNQLANRAAEPILFGDTSGKIRLVVWQEAWAMLKDHPIKGGGFANYQQAVAPYHNQWHKEITPYAIEIFLYPHNVFLNFWTEFGIFGLLVFLWLVIVFFKICWRKKNDPLVIMALVAMIALLVHGLVDVPYFKNDLAVLFWFIMVMPLLSVVTHEHRRDAQWYDMVVAGTKVVEARLNDEKRQVMRVGDHIKIWRRPEDGQHVLVEIVALHPAPTFEELLRVISPADLGHQDAPSALEVMRCYYSEADELRYGVLGIRVRLL